MTRKLFLIAGVAGLALAAPASAERGNRDRDSQTQASESRDVRKAERSQRTQRAERPQRAERQRVQKAERPQRAERQRIQRAERTQRVERQRTQRAERAQRVERQRTQRAERAQRVERQRIQRAERSQRVERQEIRRVERPQRIERQRVKQAERTQRVERQEARRAERLSVERFNRRQTVDRSADLFDRQAIRESRRDAPRRVELANREFSSTISNRPIRPMKFKSDQRIVTVGDRIDPVRFTSFVPTTYRTRYFDTPDYYYRYDDDLGYLYRIDRDDNFVLAQIPLFGGYGLGDPWPRMYYSSYVPLAYRDYYSDTPDYYYRYDGYGIYRIDAGTQLITALVALLTGQGYGVGQLLPSSYGVYNVPLGYRSNYYDRNDAWYRYGDGYIYQMAPYSRLVEARYPLHADDYFIGQPWPVAYPDYNVPLGYQSLYYDTPQYHYRYANGAIYQIDPATQVIMALVALVSGQQFSVGQPLPIAYSAYNVPLAYRDQYFDNDDDWYRYANGYIYRVDPVTGLIDEAIPIYA